MKFKKNDKARNPVNGMEYTVLAAEPDGMGYIPVMTKSGFYSVFKEDQLEQVPDEHEYTIRTENREVVTGDMVIDWAGGKPVVSDSFGRVGLRAEVITYISRDK